MSNAQNNGPSATLVAGSPSAPAAAPPTPLYARPVDLVGTILSDRYRILKKLGEGGMGTVYLAEHTTINKKLAIKVLSPEYTHKQDLIDRFLQEARAASMIEQENVVEITDFGSTPTGSVFFVMEYLAGEDLSNTIRSSGPMSWARAKPIMLQICAALEAAHAVGIIHRDMKPENCFRLRRRGNDDFIKVLDFGIAKVTSDDGEGGRALTRTGMIFGTPEYMSPEQAKGERVDHRADVYAVGVILYELLTGRVPFTADTFMGILTQHMFEAPPAPSAIVPTADIPEDVEAIVLKALQKDREYRFQSMAEMAQAIRAVGTGAAAVSVIEENVATPTTGRIHFNTGSTGVPVVPAAFEAPPAKARAGLFVGGAVAAVLIIGAGIFTWSHLSAGAKDDPSVSDELVVAGVGEAPVADEPVPSDESPEVPKVDEPRTVTVTIATPGLEANVYDAVDNGLIGQTNRPLELPFSMDPLDVYVRADGRETQLLQIVPNGEKTVPAELPELESKSQVRTGSGKTSSRSKGKGKSAKNESKQSGSSQSADAQADASKSETPKPKPKAETKSSSSSSHDLKDPFAKN